MYEDEHGEDCYTLVVDTLYDILPKQAENAVEELNEQFGLDLELRPNTSWSNVIGEAQQTSGAGDSNSN